MKFLYTGAPKYNISQLVAKKSLGGFLSSTEIPNDFSENVFSSLSELAKQSLKREVVLIALKNDDTEAQTGIVVEFIVDDWNKLSSEFSIAFVASKTSWCGDIYFASINDQQALPYLNFQVLSEDNFRFDLGNFSANEVVGIWLVRKVLKDGYQVAPLSDDELYANYLDGTELPTEETFSINVQWDFDESDSASNYFPIIQ